MVVRSQHATEEGANYDRHILTGLGVYYYIQFLLYLRLCLEGDRKLYDFVWAYGCLPYVERNSEGKRTKLNGTKQSNGLKQE